MYQSICGGNTWGGCQGHLLNVSLDLLCGNTDCLRLFPLSVCPSGGTR